MARFLVAGGSGFASRDLLGRIGGYLQGAGHEVVAGPLTAAGVRECDGVIVDLDAPVPSPEGVAAAALGHALDKPVLGLMRPDSNLAMFVTHPQAPSDHQQLGAALASFVAAVHPHAGKVVRDQVPRLVREAGHPLLFREAAPNERAEFLRRKVAEEARELESGDATGEKEKVADLLEALEAFLHERGVEKEDLRLVKQAKWKRRGGFERCFVVEAGVASPTNAEASLPREPDPPQEPVAPTHTPRRLAVADAPAHVASPHVPTPRDLRKAEPPVVDLDIIP